MAHGKSLQLRNITRPRPHLFHKSWLKVFTMRRGVPELSHLQTFGPYVNPGRPARKAAVLAKRRAAKARRT